MRANALARAGAETVIGSEWGASTGEISIGKDVLELVSSAMYVDPMTIYREYVQNAADAIDEARELGILDKDAPGCVDISIDSAARTVRLRDNGTGVPSEHFARRLTSLGASPKRSLSSRGFRGVGRLAGLAYCQELIFRSRAKGEREVSELRWDCRRLKSALRSSDERTDLRALVRDVVSVRRVSAHGEPAHFFDVLLKGVIRDKNDRLLSPQAVGDYLSQVAPVPFSEKCPCGSEIAAAIASQVLLANLHLTVSGLESPICRPHRAHIDMGDGGVSAFGELEMREIPGIDGNTAAIAWILHHDYLGAIPQGAMVKGLRLRAGNIQVGDHSLLEHLFPEPRFNTWCVGEIHVIDRQIVPNGRRDHFEQNAHYNNLLNHLAPIARDIARRCRSSSIRRKWLRDFEMHHEIASEKIAIIAQGTLPPSERKQLARSAEKAIAAMEKIAHMDGLDLDPDQSLKPRVTRIQKKLLAAMGKGGASSPLATLPAAKRKMYEHLFALIYECSSNRVAAKSLVDRILLKVT
jgi:molecular chaperone HtpG